MGTYALRRLLWALPNLFGISVVVFLLTSLLPPPPSLDEAALRAAESGDFADYDRIREVRAGRFADLPRFFNRQPVDVRVRAARWLRVLSADDPSSRALSPLASRELVRLGGAALPYVLPALPTLKEDARRQVARALEPLALRMGVHSETDFRTDERAVRFWMDFWDDRSLDYAEGAVRRAVHRLATRGSEMHVRDVQVLDTAALGELIATLARATPEEAQRLTRAAVHATGALREVFDSELDPESAAPVVAAWQEWLFLYESDFAATSSAERIAASLTETQYGKWLTRLASGRLGLRVVDGQPVAPRLAASVWLSATEIALALLASGFVAVGLGVLAAWQRGSTSDAAVGFALLGLQAVPTFWMAELLSRAFSGRSILGTTVAGADFVPRFALAVLTLALSSLAVLSREQRSAMLEVLRQDYVRTARAKGLSLPRMLVVHAVRASVVRTLTLTGLQLPVLLGASTVVETVFGLRGFGYELVVAVQRGDVAWLMASTMLAATMVHLALFSVDVLTGALDPRVRFELTRPPLEVS